MDFVSYNSGSNHVRNFLTTIHVALDFADSISKPTSPEEPGLFSDMVSVPTSGKQIKDERETFKNFLQAINLMPRVAKQQDTASTFSVSTKLRYLHVHLVDGGFDNLAKKGKGKNRVEVEDPSKRRRQVNGIYFEFKAT